jgi:hypothetical protein
MNTNLGVNARGAQVGMTQELLNEPDVCTIFQHQSGTGIF